MHGDLTSEMAWPWELDCNCDFLFLNWQISGYNTFGKRVIQIIRHTLRGMRAKCQMNFFLLLSGLILMLWMQKVILERKLGFKRHTLSYLLHRSKPISL